MNVLFWLKISLLKVVNWFRGLLLLRMVQFFLGDVLYYIPYSSKHQVIISNNHPIASLLVFYIYETNFHSRRDLTLNLLRESYWIINAKSLICTVLKSCPHCKHLRNQPKQQVIYTLKGFLLYYHLFILLG